MTRQEWIKEARFYEKKVAQFRADGDESMASTMQVKADACYANAADAPDPHIVGCICESCSAAFERE